MPIVNDMDGFDVRSGQLSERHGGLEHGPRRRARIECSENRCHVSILPWMNVRPGGGQTGFKFGPVTAENLAGVLQRACATFHDVAAWRRIQRNGMSIDVSWRTPASRYADLYSSLVEVPQEKVA
jgi:hypothetical protein